MNEPIDVPATPHTYEEQAALHRRHLLRHQFQEFTDTTQRWHDGEAVTPGDCWRACLASLLEVPLAEVPHFIHLYPAPDVEGELPDWWAATISWVEEQRPGWTLRAWDRHDPWRPIYDRDVHEGQPSRVILTGPSPRGEWHHSVLVFDQDGTLAHDPFPGGRGVLPGGGDVAALVRPEWLGES